MTLTAIIKIIIMIIILPTTTILTLIAPTEITPILIIILIQVLIQITIMTMIMIIRKLITTTIPIHMNHNTDDHINSNNTDNPDHNLTIITALPQKIMITPLLQARQVVGIPFSSPSMDRRREKRPRSAARAALLLFARARVACCWGGDRGAKTTTKTHNPFPRPPLQTFGEMSMEQKGAISHRGRALQLLKTHLMSLV